MKLCRKNVKADKRGSNGGENVGEGGKCQLLPGLLFATLIPEVSPSLIGCWQRGTPRAAFPTVVICYISVRRGRRNAAPTF